MCKTRNVRDVNDIVSEASWGKLTEYKYLDVPKFQPKLNLREALGRYRKPILSQLVPIAAAKVHAVCG